MCCDAFNTNIGYRIRLSRFFLRWITLCRHQSHRLYAMVGHIILARALHITEYESYLLFPFMYGYVQLSWVFF